jgi:molecular chaperone DnaK
MVKDAEMFSKADKERRENVDNVNEAESTCYQASKQLESLDNSLAETDKSKVNALITEIKDLLAAGDNILHEQVKSKTTELRELMATLIQNIPDQDIANASSESEDGTVETEISS